MFGANPIAMPATPMAVAWRPGGKPVMAMVCMKRHAACPVDMAWHTRPASITPKFDASRSSTAPAKKNAEPDEHVLPHREPPR